MNETPIGAIVTREGDIELSSGRPRLVLEIANRAGQPVRISSHYPLWQINAAMELDREAAWGYHLDIPAGASRLWEPGEVRTVEAVAFAGVIGAQLAEREET